MTVATSIALADALATPVVHTFVPMGKDAKNDIFWFVDQSQSNAIGFWRISVEIKQPEAPKTGQSSSERTYRFRIGLHEPILETLSNNSSGLTPSPTVAYIPRAFTEYILSERSSQQDRKNLRKMNYLLQNDANIIAVVENLFYLV